MMMGWLGGETNLSGQCCHRFVLNMDLLFDEVIEIASRTHNLGRFIWMNLNDIFGEPVCVEYILFKSSDF